MNNKVYLFEMDPQLVPKKDVGYMYYTIFKTIYIDKKDVVLSFNQLVDSHFFFDLWYIPENEKGTTTKSNKTKMRGIFLSLLKENRIYLNRYEKPIYTCGVNSTVEINIIEINNFHDYLSAIDDNFVVNILKNLPSLGESKEHQTVYSKDQISDFKKTLIQVLTTHDNSQKTTLISGLKQYNFQPPDIIYLNSYVQFLHDLHGLYKYIGYTAPKDNDKCFKLDKTLDKIFSAKLNKLDELNELDENLHEFYSNTNSLLKKVENKNPHFQEILNRRSVWHKYVNKEYDIMYASILKSENDNQEEKINQLNSCKNKLNYIIDVCYNIVVENSIGDCGSGISNENEIVNYFYEKYKSCRYELNDKYLLEICNIIKNPRCWIVKLLRTKIIPAILTFCCLISGPVLKILLKVNTAPFSFSLLASIIITILLNYIISLLNRLVTGEKLSGYGGYLVEHILDIYYYYRIRSLIKKFNKKEQQKDIFLTKVGN